jgi:hypothetical protein
MKQVQIPVSPVVNIAMISAAWSFTIVFCVAIENLKHVASLTYVPLCASACAKIYILLLILNDFRFLLLLILAVKFILIGNKMWSIQSER